MTDYDSDTEDSTDYRDPETLRRLYWDEGLSISDIADRFGVSTSPISDVMMEHGIERRDPWEWRNQPQAGYTHHDGKYPMWVNWHNGEQTNVKVHQILAVADGYSPAEVFDEDTHIHHKNGIPWDNRPENIELLSASEHLSTHQTGESNENATLSEEDVLQIKKLLRDSDMIQSEIAERYGVEPAAISKINTGRKWTHIELPP